MAYATPFTAPGDKGHILSQFARSRVAAGSVKELRISMNGWRAQLLVHSFGRVAEGIVVEELSEYIESRNISVKSLAAANLTAAIRGAKPLKLRYNFGTKAWDLQLKPFPVVYDFDYMSMGRELRRQAQSYELPGWKGFGTYQHLVYDWTPTAALTMDGLNPANDPTFEERLLRPLDWFVRLMAKYGVPTEEFGHYGYVGNPSSYNGSAYGNYGGNAKKDTTVILGPTDYANRRPLFIGPRIGDLAVIVIDPSQTNSGSNPSYYDAVPRPTIKYKTGMPGVSGMIPVEVNPMIHSSVAFGAKTGVANVIYRATEGFEVALHSALTPAALTMPDPKAAYAFLNDQFIGSRNEGEADTVVRTDVLESATWRIVAPKGFLDIYIPGSATAYDPNGGYAHDVIHVQPTYLGVCTTMAPVREYLVNLKNDPKTTPIDRKRYEDALASSASYADAKLYMSVYADAVTPPTLDMIKNLQIVKDSTKAEKDLMVEDLGNGNTLEAAGKRLEAERNKSKLYYGFVYQYDEAATADDLFSSYVASRPNGYGWILTGTTDGMTGVISVTGSFDGAPSVPIMDIEAAYLRAKGAKLAGTLTDAVIANQFGYDAASQADLLTLCDRALVPAGKHTYLGAPRVPEYAMKPVEFTNRLGYPVVRYPDLDSMVRAVTMFKGFGDDASNILLTLFFTNQLDVITE